MSNISIRRIPFIGNTLYHAGQVYDIVATPCNADPMLIVEAAFNYVPRAIWMLVKPSPVDFLTERFSRHHKKITKRKGEIELIEDMKITPKGVVAKAALRLINIEERIGWYLLIADVTTDFLVNWTSMVYVFSGCDVAGTSYQWIRRNIGTSFGQAMSATGLPIGGYDTRGGSPTLPAPPAVRHQTAGPCVVTGGVTVTAINPGAHIDKIALCQNVTGFPILDEVKWQTGKTRIGDQINFSSRDFSGMLAGLSYVLRVYGSGGNIAIAGQYLNITDTLDKGLKPDP